MLIQDNQRGVVHDASQLLISAAWVGELSGRPGRLTFGIVRDGDLRFQQGSPVLLEGGRGSRSYNQVKLVRNTSGKGAA